MGNLIRNLQELPPEQTLYLLQTLATHLAEAGQIERLEWLLTHYEYLEAKLRLLGPQPLINDYDHIDDIALRGLQSTLRLSINALNEDRSQLPGQLLGRLMGQEEPRYQPPLKQAAERSVYWLRPITPSLTSHHGPLIRTIELPDSEVLELAITPDGKQAFVVFKTGIVIALDLNTGEIIRQWDKFVEKTQEMCDSSLAEEKRGLLDEELRDSFSAFSLFGQSFQDCTIDYLSINLISKIIVANLFLNDNNILVLWDLQNYDVKIIEEQDPQNIGPLFNTRSVRITTDGKRVISAQSSGLGLKMNVLKIWDTDSCKLVKTISSPSLTEFSDQGESLAVTPDCRLVICALENQNLKVWNLEFGTEICTLIGHEEDIIATAITMDGKRAISTANDRVNIWNLETEEEISIPSGSFPKIDKCVCLHQSRHVVASTEDYTILVIDMDTGEVINSLVGHSDSITKLAICTDDKIVLSTSEDGILKCWDIKSHDSQTEQVNHQGEVSDIALMPDGQHVITASNDKTIKIWDYKTGTLITTLIGHNGSVSRVAVHPNGKLIVSASGDSSDSTIIVWDREKGEPLHKLQGHHHGIMAMKLTPDGNRVLAMGDGGILRVYEVQTGKELWNVKGGGGWPSALAITPDGDRVVAQIRIPDLDVFDLSTGANLFTLKGHTEFINSLAILPNGKRAISANKDGLFYWDIEIGQEICRLDNNAGWLKTITPNGQYAISSGNDDTLKVWNLMENKLERTINCQGNPSGVVPTPNGYRIISFSEDFSIRVLDFETGGLIASFFTDSAPTCYVTAGNDFIIVGDSTGCLHFLELETPSDFHD